jgi:hypothetical protein
VKQETGTFKVTVVDMPGIQTGSDAAVMKEATDVVVGGGSIKFDIPRRVRAVYGRQLGISGRTVATPTSRCSTGITASIRSRAKPLSLAGRQRLRQRVFSNRLIARSAAHCTVEDSPQVRA